MLLERNGFFSKKRRKRLRQFGTGIICFLIALAIFSYVTNPFVEFSIVADPFEFALNRDTQLELKQVSELRLRTNVFVRLVADLKSGWHIFNNRFTGGKTTFSGDIEPIIQEIHALRFDPELPYLISGDHFSLLYPRSLGIFYHTLLDPRTALDSTDWLHRETIYLKTLAYALDVFAKSKDLSTTIVPIAPQSVTLLNIYSPPIDTLYSLLYGLQTLQTPEELISIYPFTTNNYQSTHTVQAARNLLHEYKPELTFHFHKFISDTVDLHTHLVRTDRLFSGTKDITKQTSSFYDNVILWKTYELAQKLGLIEKNPDFLASLKTQILSTFWLPEQGHFLEDLSPESRAGNYYSSDWLISAMTGFLDPKNPDDRAYLEKTIAYIHKNKIDEPFALRYHNEPRRSRQYFPVRIFAPSYGSTTIWSNWGMEYTKLLSTLGLLTCNEEYIQVAEKQLRAYTENIKKYRGYPEVYATDGSIYAPFVYKSVVRTGWVVSFEQARMQYKWVKKEMEKCTN